MGWHSDDEKELGELPTIASVSLGAARVMKFKHKLSKIGYELLLNDSSLLIMQGNTQKEWLHSIPKTKASSSGRINITFRFVKN
jgi:alkylated DNA repair dioxygenase AlkB